MRPALGQAERADCRQGCRSLQGERKNPADRDPKALNRRGRNREEAITPAIVAERANPVNKIFGFFAPHM
jgi:hypothetical protein